MPPRTRPAPMSKRKAFALRISEDILKAMQHWSEDELRSVNGQIEYVLREALRKASRLPDNQERDGNSK